MKKILASLLTVVFMSSLLVVNAKGDKDNFQFGIRMGVQLSNVEGNLIVPSGIGIASNIIKNSDHKKQLIGPAFGFIFEIPIHKYFEIRPELNFGSQGRRFKNKDVVYAQWIGAVQLPILFRGQVGSETVRGFLQAGPQFGVNAFLFDRLKNGSEILQKKSYSMKDAKLKAFETGLAIGAGVEFPSIAGLEIEARYYLGLTDINNNKAIKSATKNRSLHLTVAFKI